MLLLGLDIGTSSIKVAIVDAQTQQTIATAQYPDAETPIKSLQKGWAEQSPKVWWEHAKLAIKKAHATNLYQPSEIGAIGIAYQMHGLVCVDKDGHLLRDSIIWCDSRAVEFGKQAFDSIGHDQALSHLLNSPGNFTASKLAWVKNNEPEVYNKIAKVMLPGDYVALQLTGKATTSISSLSEGIFWDFQTKSLSEDIFNYYGLDKNHIPSIQNVFSEHGQITTEVATELGLKSGIPVTYKAGDQPNNALSLNVLEPGDVAATAGTSGVIYGVTDQLRYDQQSRVNSFAHVNHTSTNPRIGVLLCINGTGILNSWIKQIAGAGMSYDAMNQAAASIAPGSDGLYLLPFGNGAERMLENKTIDAHMSHINLNKHSAAHLFRAAQEGITFAFRYGLDIMRSNGMQPAVIRAGKANMFLSQVFTNAFVNATNTKVELHDCDGSVGAAIGAGIGVGIYQNAREAFSLKKALETIEPDNATTYDQLYGEWLQVLHKQMK
jgi:xylulokinase